MNISIVKSFSLLTLFLLLFIVGSCSDSGSNDNGDMTGPDLTNDEDDSDNNGEKIYITDQTGKRWDITHAVNKYNMDPDNFNFGLGPNALIPITNPEFIEPGHINYPDSNATMDIIGVSGENQARAYPINVLSKHEVVNDTFLESLLAAVY